MPEPRNTGYDAVSNMIDAGIGQRLDLILDDREPTMEALYEAKELLAERDRRRSLARRTES